MKRLTFPILFLICCLPVFSASPSFDSFDTNDFITVKATAPWKIHANRSTVAITNLYVTNLYVTNLFIGKTNYYDPTQFSYDPSGDNTVHIKDLATVTNLLTTGLYTFGQVIFGANSATTLALGANTLSAINKGTLWISATTTNSADTTVNVDNGNGYGQLLIVENRSTNKFTWPAIQVQAGDPTKTNHLNSDWIPSRIGESLWLYNDGTGFTEVSRPGATNQAQLWENVGGTNLQPVDLGLQPMIKNGLFIGEHAEGYLFNPLTNGEAFYAWNETSQGDPDNLFASIGAGTSAKNSDWFVTGSSDTIDMVVRHSSAAGAPQTIIEAGPAAVSIQGKWGTTNYWYFVPQEPDGSTPFKFNTMVTHTTGNLFELANNGTNRLEVNYGGTLTLDGDDTTTAVLSPQGNLATLFGTAGVSLVSGLSGSDPSIRWFGNVFAPLKTNSILGADLNISSKPWAQVNALTNDVYGFRDSGTTNYSRLEITHAGTNSSILFDSQSGGIAGNARPFGFEFNGTNLLSISASSGDHLKISNPFNQYIVVDQTGGTTVFDAGAIGAVYISGASENLTAFTDVGNLVSGQRLELKSTVAATSSTPQNSQSFIQWGTGWNTNNAASEAAGFASRVEPLSGANQPPATLYWYSLDNAGGPTFSFGLSSQGPAILAGITKAQKTAITGLTNGMIVYQTDNTPGLRAYVNGSWVMISTVADP